jgi:hypothetical protein
MSTGEWIILGFVAAPVVGKVLWLAWGAVGGIASRFEAWMVRRAGEKFDD